MMHPLDHLLENPLVQRLHRCRREELVTRFPHLAKCPDRRFLALAKYLYSSPERFYLDAVYQTFLSWLLARDQQERLRLQGYMIEHAAELDRAFLHLQEVNSGGWHDDLDSSDDYQLVRFIDGRVHPAYLRLIEGVLAPLLRIIAYFSRCDRNKGTDDLVDTCCVMQEIRLSLPELAEPYRHVVRNGIAHGGIEFLFKQVLYRDKKGNEEVLDDRDVIQNFDNLLDTCNALVLALSVFLLAEQVHGYTLPSQLLVDELRAETRTPWWDVQGCIPQQLSGKKQLVVYARVRTNDTSKVAYSAIQTGILAESLASGYDRYFVSLHSKKTGPGWAALDGKKMRELRSSPDVQLEDYRDAVENNLVFFIPRFKVSRLASRVATFVLSFRLQWPLAMANMRAQMGWPAIHVRDATIHRNGWRCVLNAKVYIEAPDGRVDQDLVRRVRRRVVSKALSHARRSTPWANIDRYLPLGFALVSMYRKDYRRRRLRNFGLGKDLVGTIQFRRIARIRCPDIIGSTVEQHGTYRLAWNRAWLESCEKEPNDDG